MRPAARPRRPPSLPAPAPAPVHAGGHALSQSSSSLRVTAKSPSRGGARSRATSVAALPTPTPHAQLPPLSPVAVAAPVGKAPPRPAPPSPLKVAHAAPAPTPPPALAPAAALAPAPAPPPEPAPVPAPVGAPTPRGATTPSCYEAEENGPLWNTVKRQLYRSEVSHVKRLVGESLINRNALMWEEIGSLKQMLSDFQEQNDELSDSLRNQMNVANSQHRDLLKRQARLILEDVKSQAEAVGHCVEDMLPEFKDPNLSDFIHDRPPSCRGFGCGSVMPPLTPSTRPSSASGRSGCSTPDPKSGKPPLPLGRQFDVDELSDVAEGIREALESEQQSLLAVINEQMELLEAENNRRTEALQHARSSPSTSDLQQLVHKMQDLATSPTFKTLALGRQGNAEEGPDGDYPAGTLVPITGGSNVRRLRALISQRRRAPPPAADPVQNLGPVPEVPEIAMLGGVPEVFDTALAACLGYPTSIPTESPFEIPGMPGLSGAPAVARRGFDPFFGDPFA